mmetsp:Transcript_98865/g.206076  ORF Transcript_98865/g.206076 Transcript_98865/m.206076 type:complete len:209 (-) Transcript_98865:546-1172(-)
MRASVQEGALISNRLVERFCRRRCLDALCTATSGMGRCCQCFEAPEPPKQYQTKSGAPEKVRSSSIAIEGLASGRGRPSTTPHQRRTAAKGRAHRRAIGGHQSQRRSVRWRVGRCRQHLRRSPSRRPIWGGGRAAAVVVALAVAALAAAAEPDSPDLASISLNIPWPWLKCQPTRRFDRLVSVCQRISKPPPLTIPKVFLRSRCSSGF